MGCSSSNVSETVSQTAQKVTPPPVKVKEDPYLINSTQFITSYTTTSNGCEITWQVGGDNKVNKPYYLRLRYGNIKNECPDFKEQKIIHRHILNTIFSQHNKQRFGTLSTGSLYLIEPTYRLNVRIAEHATKNVDWLDYTKNYPHHKSKKSSNDIFVEVAGQANACEEIIGLFAEYGFRLKLKFVEKVFAQHLEKLPFKEKLKVKQFNRRIMYDAGTLDFELTLK